MEGIEINKKKGGNPAKWSYKDIYRSWYRRGKEAVVESKGRDMEYREKVCGGRTMSLLLLTIATGAIASKWTIWTVVLN